MSKYIASLLILFYSFLNSFFQKCKISKFFHIYIYQLIKVFLCINVTSLWMNSFINIWRACFHSPGPNPNEYAAMYVISATRASHLAGEDCRLELETSPVAFVERLVGSANEGWEPDHLSWIYNSFPWAKFNRCPEILSEPKAFLSYLFWWCVSFCVCCDVMSQGLETTFMTPTRARMPRVEILIIMMLPPTRRNLRRPALSTHSNEMMVATTWNH